MPFTTWSSCRWSKMTSYPRKKLLSLRVRNKTGGKKPFGGQKPPALLDWCKCKLEINKSLTWQCLERVPSIILLYIPPQTQFCFWINRYSTNSKSCKVIFKILERGRVSRYHCLPFVMQPSFSYHFFHLFSCNRIKCVGRNTYNNVSQLQSF